MSAPLELDRDQVIAFRRRVGALDARLPPGPASLRLAAWGGLPDSMPRAGLLALHARVDGVHEATLDEPTLAQVWGPRFSDYVIAEADAAPFTLGRLPDEPGPLRRAEDMASRLDAFLDGRRMPYGTAGHAMGIDPNALRYGTATGRLRIRWDGARQPIVWTVPPPTITADDARLELARRYLHVLGPGTAAGFGRWAGIRPARARRIVQALRAELLPARTAAGDGWILASDEPGYRAVGDGPVAPARLLPSGDTYVLLWGADRGLLVPEPDRQARLWTSRVWPGAVMAGGRIVGTWRRADADLAIEPWQPLRPGEREAIEAEAVSLPLPGLAGRIRVRWVGP